MTFNDLKNVAVWDLTANRGEYKKKCLSIVIFYGFLLFVHIIPQVWQLLTMGTDNISLEVFHIEDIGYSVTLFTLSYVAYILLMGNMFKVLVTKQGRINEFMLPADNSTRFVWRTIVTVVGTALMLLAGILCYDLLQMLIHRVAFSDYNVQSVFVMYHSVSDVAAQIRREFDDSSVWFFLGLMRTLAVVALASTYVLGSSIKYKRSILWTTLCHFLLWVLLITLMIFLATVCEGGLMRSIILWLIRNEDSLAWLSDNVWVIFLIPCLIEAGIIWLLWRMTYKRYCKAQLTTRMNP